MFNPTAESVRVPSIRPQVFAVTSILLVITASAQQRPATSQPASHAQAASYGALPLAFEANRGQADGNVRFVARGQGYSLFLTDLEAVLALHKADECRAGKAQTAAVPEACAGKQDLVRMKLAGAPAVPAARATGEDELPGRVNYFIGNDPAKWRADLPTYSKVRYAGVYPGVDLIYYGNQRQLEYDFVVAPGASAHSIKLQFDGARRLTISASGDLVLKGIHGQAVFHKPVIYQVRNTGPGQDEQRQTVDGKFRLTAKNTVGFTLKGYDRTRPLVIDPVLVYSTYLGGSGVPDAKHSNGYGDQANGIAVDSAGSAYVVGTTYSADFPVTCGAYRLQNNAALAGYGSTVFVTKLSATGKALVYSTYLGGTGSANGGDFGYGIALDADNNAYVTGATYSKDFPVTSAALKKSNPSTTRGAPTAFVAKLNATGTSLTYSTYLGGGGNHASPAQGDVAQAIVVDSTGNAYLTGYTFSSDFPVGGGSFQNHFAGGPSISNAFVTKLNPGGTSLVYSTYLGGSGSHGAGDYGNAIAIDAAGDAFVAGSTASSNFPVTGGAYQTTFHGPTAFVTELNPRATAAVYSTYLGGSGGDSAQAIAVDKTGFAYVAGNTSSSDFPLTAGVLEGASNGIGAYFGVTSETFFTTSGAFVTKLKGDGTALEYSTYLQGAFTSAADLAVDSAGTAYIVGSAPTTGAGYFGGFQATPDGLSTPVSTGNDGYLFQSNPSVAFLVELDPSAATLKYASLLGGSFNDGATALALDSAGNAYVTGFANSANFPTTSGAFLTANLATAALASNAIVSKFALAREANHTTYPSLPTNIATSLSGSGLIREYCDENYFVIGADVNLSTSAFGPPPTGTIEVEAIGALLSLGPPNGVWGGGGNGGGSYTSIDIPFGEDAFWIASYSGDSVYSGSTAHGDVPFPGCSQRAAKAARPPAPEGQAGRVHVPLPQASGRTKFVINLSPARSAQTNPASAVADQARHNVLGPKFIPTPVAPHEDEQNLPAASSEGQTVPACVVPNLPNLVVTVRSVKRLYGAANPKLTYSVSGLLNGDTVTVDLSTTATTASPAGTYLITAAVSGAAATGYNVFVSENNLTVLPAPLTVAVRGTYRTYGAPNPTFTNGVAGLVNGDTIGGTLTITDWTYATTSSPVGKYDIIVTLGGSAAANYNLIATNTTLEVLPAQLTVLATSYGSVYGTTPASPTAYTITGFVNGEGSYLVNGTPTLSSNVTSTTPVGTYRIGVSLIGFFAPNYTMQVGTQGGWVQVYKAPLTLTANSITMHHGQPVPPLTYTLTGFVNGETASVVSGAPVLTTTATSSSPPGNYAINLQQGTLNAANYGFVTVVNHAAVTVLP